MTTAAAPRAFREDRARRLPTTIGEDDFQAILAELPQTSATRLRNRAILHCMFDAGLRVSELCALAPGDVNRRNATLRVFGKGRRERIVPLTGRALSAILAWEGKRGTGGAYEFCTVSDRGRLSRRYLHAMVTRYAGRAGVVKTTRDADGTNRQTPIHPHVLRHSFATRALRNGVNVDEVRHWLGHSFLSTTSVYLHVENAQMADRLREALEPDTSDAGGTRGLVAGVVRDELRDAGTAEFVAQLREQIRADLLAELTAKLEGDRP